MRAATGAAYTGPVQESPISRRGRIAAAVAAFAAAPVLFLLTGRGGPLFTDEGSLLLVGHRIAEGGRIYADIVNEKPPALFLFSSLFMGENPFPHLVWFRLAVTLAAGAGAVFTAWRLADHGKTLRGTAGGIALMLVFALHSGFQWSPNSFITLAAMALPGLLAAGIAPGNQGNWVRAGLLCGFLILVRFQNLPLVLAAAACAWIRPFPESRRERFACFAGGFAGSVTVVLIYLAATGTLAEAFRITVLENLRMAGALGSYAFSLSSPLLYLPMLLAGAYACGYGSPRFGKNERLTFLLLLFAGAFLSAFPRLDIMRCLPAAALAVLAFAELAPERPAHYRQAAIAGFALLLLVFASRIAAGYAGRLDRDLATVRTAALRLNQLDPSGSQVLIFPAEPFLYLAADRKPASRRYFVNPWRSSPEIQRELAAGLEKNGFPPVVDTQAFVPIGYPARPEDYAPEFLGFRSRHYRLAETLPSGIGIWLYSDGARDSR